MKIGILGGGQLAQMLALAGIPLGFRFVFYEPASECCASALGEHHCGAYDDEDSLRRFAEKVEIITYEFENVSIDAINFLNKIKKVYPSQIALESTQDRWVEKSLFKTLNIDTPEFCKIETFQEVENAIKKMGLPLVLKSRTGGYDGKGQVVIRQLEEALEKFNTTSKKNLIAEAWVPYQREVSVVAVRNSQGQMKYYDLVENIHQDGILQRSFNRPNDLNHKKACELISLLMNHLNYVGVLALELFEVKGGFLANEYAPRVHNTGHWTIEGAKTSQFENHLRAVVGLPLGSTQSIGFSSMVNFIGKVASFEKLKDFQDGHFHDYGKISRGGRKVGHFTIVGNDKRIVENQAAEIVAGLENGSLY